MAKKGLGKGLDSLIPDFYNEDFDSNSTQSLEDLLNENDDDVETPTEENFDEQKNIFDEIRDEVDDQEDTAASDGSDEIKKESREEEKEKDDKKSPETSEINDSNLGSQDNLQAPQEVKIQKEHVAEVKEIVNKNPRITLWSSRSSAVFRYLRKTEPEFSISKEASVLIEEAVSKKYPEIWALFDDQ